MNLKSKIRNKLYLIKTNFINFIVLRILKKPFLKSIPFSILFLNFIFKFIFRLNANSKFLVHFTSKIQGSENIILPNKNFDSILRSFASSGGCYYAIFSGSTLKIGENTIWSTNVCIQTGNHDLLNRNKLHINSVEIGNNCWIGSGAVILAGVILGDNVTVGANSTVTKSFPSNCVIGGSPARLIKYINVN
ncbi:MAG: acetyltransferase [Crocinitomicaceae bacterium]|nr:acetyltransferase [Crocinitomicaceae bacterium]